MITTFFNIASFFEKRTIVKHVSFDKLMTVKPIGAGNARLLNMLAYSITLLRIMFARLTLHKILAVIKMYNVGKKL